MFFRILSHAGMEVRAASKTLLFDPWLIGSTYWRSWWNYPPVSRELIESLRPDFIYLTHIHWDHFQSVSLRRFPQETPVLIPRGNGLRMKRDLHQIGFRNVREIRHGETVELAPGFKLTSWQFYPFTDSAAVVECEGTVLFNCNDAKFMGAPLRQILKRHPRIDFVFRSHSSANPRQCFDFTDAPDAPADDESRYARDFADFAVRAGARYAVPFASNHCFLHKEVFHLNSTVTTPAQVEEHFRREKVEGPELKIMVSGDSWDSREGFSIADGPWFRERHRLLTEYRERNAAALEKFYARETETSVNLAQVERYFRRFVAALPWGARFVFRKRPVTYVLTGAGSQAFRINLWKGTVAELEVDSVEDAADPLQIHTSAYIFRQCMARDLFLHLGISKRVRFRCKRADARYHWFLELLFNLYESEMLPAVKMLSPRFVLTWIPRWREILLYGQILGNRLRGKPFDMRDYLILPLRRGSPVVKRAFSG